MDLPDAIVERWWHLLVGFHALLLVVGVSLWVAGNRALAPLFVLLGLLLPLAVLATLLDGQ